MKYEKVVLLTGGAGFIGSAFLLLFVLKYENWLFINLDKLTYAGTLSNLTEVNNKKNYIFIKGDIADKKLVKNIFREYSVDFVLNFAAESHVDKSIVDSESFINTNILGTANLLNISLNYWLNLEGKKKLSFRFIQISTDEVYGYLLQGDAVFTEESVIRPSSPYSASKASADMLCYSYYITYEFPVIITRSSNNYGNNQHREKLIPTIINKLIMDQKVPLYGNGKNIRDWIHVHDNCYAIEMILNKGMSGQVYNIGANNEINNTDIVYKISKILGKDRDCIEFVGDRPGHDFRYGVNNNKLRSLGWVPVIDFDSGLEDVINHYERKIKNQSF